MEFSATNYPLVSILIPIYHVEGYICRCAVSLFSQTYSNLEFVFVDDSSPDTSIILLEDILKSRPVPQANVKIIHHDRNRGLAAARNTAIENATGEFIVHVDSDDWIESDAIEQLVLKQIETGADIVSCNSIAHYSDHTELMIEPEYISPSEMVHRTVEMTLDHVIWRRLIRASLYRDNGVRCVEGVNIGEDHHTLPILAYYAKSIAKVDKALWHYNCENVSSYMYDAQAGFNRKKYWSDLRSIEILSAFFKGKDDDLVDELEGRIKIDYLRRSLSSALSSGNRSAYNEIRSDSLTRYFAFRNHFPERIFVIKVF